MSRQSHKSPRELCQLYLETGIEEQTASSSYVVSGSGTEEETALSSCLVSGIMLRRSRKSPQDLCQLYLETGNEEYTASSKCKVEKISDYKGKWSTALMVCCMTLL